MINTILIVDSETTGVDAAKDHVIEIGAVLYSVKHKAVASVLAFLIHADENPAEHVNGIPVELLREHGERRLSPRPDIGRDDVPYVVFDDMIGAADIIVAHSAEFDRGFLKQHTGSKPWVCSMEDIEWPHPIKSKSLVAMALAHDVGVVRAHRAIEDCLTLAAMFERVQKDGVDLQPIFARAMRPKKMVYAIVSFDQKDLAKNVGFQWDGAKKQWWKRMVPEDAKDFPFKIRIVEG